jgi:hypothetical protein
MLDLGDYFNLHETTSHAAIAYLDRLQPNEKFSRNQWQMLGICCIILAGESSGWLFVSVCLSICIVYVSIRCCCCCCCYCCYSWRVRTVYVMFCAAKYNENEEHVPELLALQNITQQEIPQEELLKYELWALQRMGWILCARTVPAFLSCYQQLGSAFEADVVALLGDQSAPPGASPAAEIDRLDRIARKQCSNLATMVALDVRFKSFPCSQVAAAVLFVSRRCLGLTLGDVWPSELVVMTRYAVEDLASLVLLIDKASDEITRWVQSNKGEMPAEHTTPTNTTPTKTSDVSESATSIHPSKSTADPAVLGKKSLKYSFDSDEAKSALKNAAPVQTGAMNDNLSPISIAEHFEGTRPVLAVKQEAAAVRAVGGSDSAV